MQFDPNQIKLIVGLGNLGSQYSLTRHNAGFMFVDYLAETLELTSGWSQSPKLHCTEARNQNFRLAKPTTMMNLSGKAVTALINYYHLLPSQLLVVHDDLDLPLGKYKYQMAKGPLKHNGIDSVEKSIGTQTFWRLRLGIENREIKGNKGIPGVKYSLHKFPANELELIQQTIITASTPLKDL